MSMAKCLAPSDASRWVQFPGREYWKTITVAEFKDWLKHFVTDRDGGISRKELREAIRRRDARFFNMRVRCSFRRGDRNDNGYVDECEMEYLIEFAEKELGFHISS